MLFFATEIARSPTYAVNNRKISNTQGIFKMDNLMFSVLKLSVTTEIEYQTMHSHANEKACINELA